MADNFAGQLLVSPPSRSDEYWSKTSVFVYEQTVRSAKGLILNKPSDTKVADLAAAQGHFYFGDELIYTGGPANTGALVMLHTNEWKCSNTMQLTPTIRISSDRHMLRRISDGDAPDCWKMFLGMCVWSPSVLEKEIQGKIRWNRRNAWLTTELDDSVIFEQNNSAVWSNSLTSAIKTATDRYLQ